MGVVAIPRTTSTIFSRCYGRGGRPQTTRALFILTWGRGSYITHLRTRRIHHTSTTYSL